MMVVTCESCTKKYKIDETKIKSEEARLKCKNCDHYIIVKNPNFNGSHEDEVAYNSLDSASGPDESSFFPSNDSENDVMFEPGTPAPSFAEPTPPPVEKHTSAKRLSTERKGLGLKGQLFVYLFVPFLIISVAAILVSIWQLSSLVDSISSESSAIVSKFAEDAIAEDARSVAKQMSIYFKAHPEMVNSKELFQTTPEVKAIAQQKVGKTGYTVLTALDNKIMALWTHPNDKLIGVDVLVATAKLLGKEHWRFKKIVEGSFNGGESQGYYLWPEKDGTLREKFMAQVPIPGTNYFASSTTYIDEFTLPNQQLLGQIEKSKDRALWLQTAGMVVLLLLVAALVFAYGRNLTNRITRLSEVVDRISLGELEIEIKTAAKDEIGQLAEAISRMQDSLRLSIERLRRRRKKMN